jgi:hypothetical protein
MTRLINSLAFRIPSFYQFWLTKIKKPKIKKEITPIDSYHLIFLCGNAHLDLLEQALYSVLKNFKSIPKIFVFLDIGLTVENCNQRLKWVPSSLLTIKSHTECISYHQENGNLALSKFAINNPMGLKLAAILQIADLKKPFLYSDTDVLWYKDPAPIFNQIISNSDSNIHLSQDFQQAYDEHLIIKANLSGLLKAPYYCAGILFAKMITEQDLVFIQSLVRIAISKSNHFTEQTIFAALQKRKGISQLTANNFCIQVDDRFDFKPKKNDLVIARHYIGPVRHLFWRDSFFLR